MQAPPPEDALPFVAPCRVLDAGAPWRWLRLGWHDLRQAPGPSAVLGAVVVLVSVAVSALAWSLGRFALLSALLSGFVFVAPLLAVALYGVPRALATDRRPTLRACIRLARRVVGQAAVFALVQLVILLLWSRAGMMVHAFVPAESGGTGGLLELLAIGSLAGSVFAAVTFASAVFSLPLIADREMDMVTAVLSSANAVLRNKGVCLLWAALITGLTAFGFATAFFGLGVVVPWLAYAGWHAAHDAIDAAAWPPLDGP